MITRYLWLVLELNALLLWISGAINVYFKINHILKIEIGYVLKIGIY